MSAARRPATFVSPRAYPLDFPYSIGRPVNIRGKPVEDKLDLLPLVRRVQEELQLVPDGTAGEVKGAKCIESLLGNPAVIGQNLAEFRNLYGTGHGKAGSRRGLVGRHAHLTDGAAMTLAVFQFETYADRTQ